VQISERAVRRRLKQAELGSYIPARAPKLEVRYRVARLAFGHENENWNIDQWSQVLFTDESPFCVNTIVGRERIWRRLRGRYSQCNFQNCLLVEAELWPGAQYLWKRAQNY
jgi:hypothetical protein